MDITLASTMDIPELCDLLGILFSQEKDFSPDRTAQRAGLTKIITNPETGFIAVARDDNKIVGMVNLLYTISTAVGDRVAILEDMIVLPEARGSGTGSRLLKNAIQLARRNGCKRITLLTDLTNESAKRFYRRHGFVCSDMIPLRLSLSE